MIKRLHHLPGTIQNYDPSQPRAPKGSDEGGQWTTAGGAAYEEYDQRKGRTPYKIRDAQYEDEADYLRNYEGYASGQPAVLAASLWDYELPGTRVLETQDGHIQAMVCGLQMDYEEFKMMYEIDEDTELELGDYTNDGRTPCNVMTLAAAPVNLGMGGQRGWGTEAFYQAAKDSVEQGADFIFLHPSRDAIPFYQAVGMTLWNDTYFVMSSKGRDEFIQTYEARNARRAAR